LRYAEMMLIALLYVEIISYVFHFYAQNKSS